MSEYHVGCGAFGIYSGTLNKKGDRWKNKSDVTDEVLSASAEYLLRNQKQLEFEHGGKWYVMHVREMEADNEQTSR